MTADDVLAVLREDEAKYIKGRDWVDWITLLQIRLAESRAEAAALRTRLAATEARLALARAAIDSVEDEPFASTDELRAWLKAEAADAAGGAGTTPPRNDAARKVPS